MNRLPVFRTATSHIIQLLYLSIHLQQTTIPILLLRNSPRTPYKLIYTVPEKHNLWLSSPESHPDTSPSRLVFIVLPKKQCTTGHNCKHEASELPCVS